MKNLPESGKLPDRRLGFTAGVELKPSPRQALCSSFSWGNLPDPGKGPGGKLPDRRPGFAAGVALKLGTTLALCSSFSWGNLTESGKLPGRDHSPLALSPKKI